MAWAHILLMVYLPDENMWCYCLPILDDHVINLWVYSDNRMNSRGCIFHSYRRYIHQCQC